MPVIKVPYLQQVGFNTTTRALEITSRPYVSVFLKYGQSFSPFPLKCLLDTGADRNLFPASYAERLGIVVKKGKLQEHIGIGEHVIKSYIHTVSMFVGVYSFDTEIDFSFEHQLPLLGRKCFFKHFKSITFNEEKEVVELRY